MKTTGSPAAAYARAFATASSRKFARAIHVFGIGTLGILKAFLPPAFVLVDLFGVVAERVFDFDVAAELAVEAEQRGILRAAL